VSCRHVPCSGRPVPGPSGPGQNSIRLATTPYQPIDAVADRKERKASSSYRTGSAVWSTVFVITGAKRRTALKDPVIRRHIAAIEDSSGRKGDPHYKKKHKQLLHGEHFQSLSLSRPPQSPHHLWRRLASAGSIGYTAKCSSRTTAWGLPGSLSKARDPKTAWQSRHHQLAPRD
jgi:hypothetical protein